MKKQVVYVLGFHFAKLENIKFLQNLKYKSIIINKPVSIQNGTGIMELLLQLEESLKQGNLITILEFPYLIQRPQMYEKLWDIIDKYSCKVEFLCPRKLTNLKGDILRTSQKVINCMYNEQLSYLHENLFLDSASSTRGVLTQSAFIFVNSLMEFQEELPKAGIDFSIKFIDIY